jgi:DNA-binding XRE family transcriptional regulator
MAAKKIDPRDKAFNGAIGRHLEAEGATKNAFAERVGVSRQSLWFWQKEPWKVPLGMLRVLAKEANWSDEDILQIVRGARS